MEDKADKLDWVLVYQGEWQAYTFKAAVPGGTLYRHMHYYGKEVAMSMVFVPKEQNEGDSK